MMSVALVSPSALAQMPPSEYDTAAPSLKLDVLDLRNMDVNDVLKLISQKSGLNVAATRNVNGRVTVYLKDIDVYEALRIICESNGWAYDQDNNVIQVMAAQEYEAKFGKTFGQEQQTQVIVLKHAQSKDVIGVVSQIKSPAGKVIADDRSNALIVTERPAKIEEIKNLLRDIDAPVQTQVIELVHAKAADALAQVQEFLTPVIGKIKADERSNKLIITDTAKKLVDINFIIEEIDGRDSEVLIEAKIIQIALDDAHKLGVDWQAIVSNTRSLTFTGDLDILSAGEKRGEASIGTIANDQYTALIQALETVGRTNVLSTPRIAALNNKEAKILVGSTEPYVTTTTTTPSSGPTTTAEAVNFIDVGVKLYVTPHIHSDGFITMEIKPEVSSVVDTLTTSTNNTIPIVETSEAETTIMVKDGITIVIGGLMKNSTIDTTKRVPLLGRIPVLGYAFKSNSKTVSNTELAIFLTPHLI
ncbi:MAG: hypothetical protein COW13_03385, partial [Candidatus Omnitrophica bacterium CG12_big_fil_rev_8_21_14_0_65_50_5]